jgi:DNA-binding response OmpR family regulator
MVGPVEEGGGPESPFEEFSARIHRVTDCHGAARDAYRLPPRVVVCERDLPDGCWKEILELTFSLPHPPPVIVTARLADEYLWAEVLNLGGYDVLSKPFNKQEVSRTVRLAWDRSASRQMQLHAPERRMLAKKEEKYV